MSTSGSLLPVVLRGAQPGELPAARSAAGRAAGRSLAADGCAERTTRRSPSGHDHGVDAAGATVAKQQPDAL